MNKEFIQHRRELELMIQAIESIDRRGLDFLLKINDLYVWICSDREHEAEYNKAVVSDHIREEIKEFIALDRFTLAKLQNVQSRIKSAWTRKRKFTWIAAASVIIFILASGYWLESRLMNDRIISDTAKSKIRTVNRGINKATLKLENGRIIDLTNADNGILAKQSGITVEKNQNGQLVYTVIGTNGSSNPRREDNNLSMATRTNTITTPRGGEYKIILPDGTNVWLNAASSLTFPTSFTGPRRVVLTGEAYLEVAKNFQFPFVVESGHTTVQVLGTSFNMNAYTDEQKIRTTLVQGSVKVIQGAEHIILKPGQEAQTSSASVKNSPMLVVNDIDVQMAVAWKNGFFSFKKADIKTIMRQIGRWYTVDVEYSGEPPNGKFYFKISRSAQLPEVLAALEATNNVHFKLKDNKIVVSK